MRVRGRPVARLSRSCTVPGMTPYMNNTYLTLSPGLLEVPTTMAGYESVFAELCARLAAGCAPAAFDTPYGPLAVAVEGSFYSGWSKYNGRVQREHGGPFTLRLSGWLTVAGQRYQVHNVVSANCPTPLFSGYGADGLVEFLSLDRLVDEEIRAAYRGDGPHATPRDLWAAWDTFCYAVARLRRKRTASALPSPGGAVLDRNALLRVVVADLPPRTRLVALAIVDSGLPGSVQDLRDAALAVTDGE